MGRDKTYEKIASKLYWPAIDQDIREFIQRCDVCQRTNDSKFTKGEIPLHPIRKCGSRLVVLGVLQLLAFYLRKIDMILVLLGWN